MVAMVAYPRCAKGDFAESVFPSRHTALEVVLRILVFLVSGIMEGVGCRAEADNGFAGHEVVIDIMHLFRKEITEPDRKSVVQGKRVSVRLPLECRRKIKNKTITSEMLCVYSIIITREAVSLEKTKTKKQKSKK